MNSIRSKDIFSKLSSKSAKIGCAVLLSILVVCCGTQSTRTGLIATATALLTTSPAVTLDPKIVLREGIDQVLGIDNRNLPRLTKFTYSFPESGDITITWTLNDNALQNSTKADAQMDATNILKVLESSKTRYIYVILIGTISMQDAYGNTAEIQALSLGFNKSKLDKVIWEDFQPSDVYDLADVAEIVDELK